MEADERMRKSSVDPRGEIQKGSTCGTAVGAKQGRTKGNNTGKLSKQNRKKRMRNQTGRKGKTKGTKETDVHRGAAVRRAG